MVDGRQVYFTLSRRNKTNILLTPGNYQVLVFEDRTGESPYLVWLEALDLKTQERIHGRVARLARGQFGDFKSIGRGLYELRLFFGPGYRVYFGEQRGRVILLICGGDKSTQQRDIEVAKKYWKTYLEDNL